MANPPKSLPIRITPSEIPAELRRALGDESIERLHALLLRKIKGIPFAVLPEFSFYEVMFDPARDKFPYDR